MYYGNGITFFYFAFSVRIAKSLFKIASWHNVLSERRTLPCTLSFSCHCLVLHHLASFYRRCFKREAKGVQISGSGWHCPNSLANPLVSLIWMFLIMFHISRMENRPASQWKTAEAFCPARFAKHRAVSAPAPLLTGFGFKQGYPKQEFKHWLMKHCRVVLVRWFLKGCQENPRCADILSKMSREAGFHIPSDPLEKCSK